MDKMQPIMREYIHQKILAGEALQRQLAVWKFRGDKIVFTNGCFDLLHYGHLAYLMEARSLGRRLVVGLNSDDSVKRLKGAHRPIKDQQSRLWLMASLAYVDAVVIFEEDTPERLIRSVAPDVLVKGGDYQIEQIVGADFVMAKGGEVRVLPFVPGYSTTALEDKIRRGA